MEVVVFFDEGCSLCRGAVSWLERRDRRRALRFLPLQDPEAAPYLAHASEEPGEPGRLDTLVVVERTPGRERVLVRAAAVARALRAIGGGWALAGALLSFVPRRLADAGYRYVAERRPRACPAGAGAVHRQDPAPIARAADWSRASLTSEGSDPVSCPQQVLDVGRGRRRTMAEAKDPVCGMDVDTSSARHVTDYQGERYYFCGGGCRKAFELEPAKYLDPGYRPSMLGAFKDWLRAVLHTRRP